MDSSATPAASAHVEVPQHSVPSSARPWIWPVVYLLTILAFLTWYEILPRCRAYGYVQGDWQASVGSGGKEKPAQQFLRFTYGEMRSSYWMHGGWHGAKGSFRLTPANNFFVVDRYVYYGAHPRGNHIQYIVYQRDGKLYEIRGLAELDPIKDFQTTLLRRTDDMPAAANDRLEAQ